MSPSTTTTLTEKPRAVYDNMDWLAARKREHDAEVAALQQHTENSDPTKESTTRAKGSPFLALPPELRNEIYTHLFPPGDVQRIKPSYTTPPIFLVNHQLHDETIKLYYANTIFRCLDEDSTVNWLSTLPRKYLDLIEEIRYDTRWIIFVTPFIPVPGAECWLFQKLCGRLEGRGVDVNVLGHRVDGVGEGRLKVSFYDAGGEGVRWTDKPGLIEEVRGR